ncbi:MULTISPECIES: GGDEF domain-containing protein [Rhodanobacter]|uniref:GGDEF domain-containing protein n=1 Tax=Rhodanobacter TaxID=75309 RepID=UPI0004197A50|nr:MULTISPECIES: phosphodiesterase [Rhodanobacter]KZC19355.1 diguanylate cyclase [Rhodanobacter denitrificans]UJJ50115.1 phosphodiesterase [Rhodanobacter denitrificans]UJM92830.1 phosphodiesterase [Rhodanobacter denitrificans]UJM96360.1 phosphodiesterase [Rhodanobacter denitrificans]UJN20809.1 phosphodiesterase [Rhodanobacter denitrificans]
MTPAYGPDPRHASLLDQITGGAGLRAVFQPIVRLDTLTVVAHEGLSRPAEAAAGLSVLDMLDLARAKGRLGEFELLAARTVCGAFAAQDGHGRLLVNLSAQAVLHGGLRPDEVIDALSGAGIGMERVTVEITERDVVKDPAELAHALGYLRARGTRIALDDFGNGHSNFEMWNELHPDVVKIDRYLVNGLARSAGKLAIVRALCRVAETLGADLVGEGVEEAEDLRMLRELGISYAQGYLLGVPLPSLVADVRDEARDAFRIHAVPVPPHPRGPVTQRPLQVGHLAIAAPSLAVQQLNDDVAALFGRNESLHAVAVTDHDRPVGLINRRIFAERMAQPFARELFGRKSCISFMHAEPLLCDEQQSLDSLTDVLRGEDQRYLTDGFIITREGRYLGLGTGESLVRRVTEQRIEAARHANPLTFLPGNIPVTAHIERLMRELRPFVAAYIDLNDFKPFNDQYGYFRGDEMIRLLAAIVTTSIDARHDFVGHIGGDDFMILFQSGDWETRCRSIIAAFNERSRALFDEQDLAQGGIEGEDRRGARQLFALTTVSIGAVQVPAQAPRRPELIATLAARAKRHAKRGRLGFHVLAAMGGEWPEPAA